jgi:hypothetical protein
MALPTCVRRSLSACRIADETKQAASRLRATMQPDNFRERVLEAGASDAGATNLEPAVPAVAVTAVVAVSTIPAVSVLLMLHLIADQVAKPGTAEAADRGASER